MKSFQLPLAFSTEWVLYKAVEHVKKSREGMVIFLEDRRIEIKPAGKGRWALLSEEFIVGQRRIQYENGFRIFEQEFMSALAKPNEIHIHSYRRSKTKSKDRWAQVYNCTGALCKHYTKADNIQDKQIVCFKCKDKCIADFRQLQRNVKFLTCVACSHKPEARDLIAGREVITELFGQLTKEPTVEERAALLNLPMD